jgi:hypothetical protein
MSDGSNLPSKLDTGPEQPPSKRKKPIVKKRIRPPSSACPNQRRERYCQLIAQGMNAKEAFEEAGFEGKSPGARYNVRHHPEIEARVDWLVSQRVSAQAAASAPRYEKKKLGAKDRAIRELERIAYADARQLIQWEPMPVVLPDGSIEIRNVMKVVPSDKLSADAAASVKGVMVKAGNIQIEQHDKLKALDQLARMQRLYPEPEPLPPPPPANQVTVNQVNVGERSALDVARRVAFMLGALRAAGCDPTTIDVEPQPVTGQSRDIEPPSRDSHGAQSQASLPLDTKKEGEP